MVSDLGYHRYALAVVSDDESYKDSDSENNEGWFYPMQNSPSAENDQAGDHPSQYFELGVSLSYYNRKGMAETVVYERGSPYSMSHTIRQHDGTHLTVHDSYLCLKLQPDLSKIP